MTKIFNQTSQKTKRKMLRSDMSLAERLLWSSLRASQLRGYKFRRQYSVGRFVIDFYCARAKLALEIDGDSHFMSEKLQAYDKARQKWIEDFGIKFLRFTNNEIYENIEGVRDKIAQDLR